MMRTDVAKALFSAQKPTCVLQKDILCHTCNSTAVSSRPCNYFTAANKNLTNPHGTINSQDTAAPWPLLSPFALAAKHMQVTAWAMIYSEA